jgi:anti-anti-sigma factor
MKTPERGSASLTSHDGIWQLALAGEHDLSTEGMLENRMGRVCASGTSVVIDLTQTTFIDCRIVGWLVRWQERARQSDHLHLAIVAGADGSIIRRLLDLVHLTEAVPCHESRDQAVTALRQAEAQQGAAATAR